MYAINVTSVSVNETIGERVFDFPKKSQVQIARFEEAVCGNRRQPEADRKDEGKLRRQPAWRKKPNIDKNGKVTKKEVNE